MYLKSPSIKNPFIKQNASVMSFKWYIIFVLHSLFFNIMWSAMDSQEPHFYFFFCYKFDCIYFTQLNLYTYIQTNNNYFLW